MYKNRERRQRRGRGAAHGTCLQLQLRTRTPDTWFVVADLSVQRDEGEGKISEPLDATRRSPQHRLRVGSATCVSLSISESGLPTRCGQDESTENSVRRDAASGFCDNFPRATRRSTHPPLCLALVHHDLQTLRCPGTCHGDRTQTSANTEIQSC